MRHSPFFLPILVFVGIVVGGLLYLFGGDRFSGSSNAVSPAENILTGYESFTVIAQGDDALGITQRVNYRITSAEEFGVLWEMMFNGTGGDAPIVDFSQDEVFALFDGTRSTTGFQIRVPAVEDANGVRTVSLIREIPAEDCMVRSEIRSPYVLVRVERSTLPIVRQESTATSTCPR